jgi:hypothetical protein
LSDRGWTFDCDRRGCKQYWHYVKLHVQERFNHFEVTKARLIVSGKLSFAKLNGLLLHCRRLALLVIRCAAKSLVAVGRTADFVAQPAQVYEFTP